MAPPESGVGAIRAPLTTDVYKRQPKKRGRKPKAEAAAEAKEVPKTEEAPKAKRAPRKKAEPKAETPAEVKEEPKAE